MAGGDVYVAGRVKDIIIRAGRHLYPQDIEEAVADVPGIRKGGVAVFGVADPAAGTERVVVLAETRETDPARRATLQSRAHEVVTDAAGAPPDEIVLAPPGSVPKTSSGKIRRSAAKELYESGAFERGQERLGRVTKMGDRYLRKLLVWAPARRFAIAGAITTPCVVGRARCSSARQSNTNFQADRGGARQQGRGLLNCDRCGKSRSSSLIPRQTQRPRGRETRRSRV